MFNAAARRGIIANSPFRDLTSTSIAADREYLDVAASERVPDALPDVQWRILWRLARYAGLRCPSETHRITWADVDFDKGQDARLVAEDRTVRRSRRSGSFRLLPG